MYRKVEASSAKTRKNEELVAILNENDDFLTEPEAKSIDGKLILNVY